MSLQQEQIKEDNYCIEEIVPSIGPKRAKD
jgi:hypothetical protein